MRRPVVLVAVAVLVLAAGVRFVPWLTTKQDIELSSPRSPPFNIGLTWVDVDPGQELCVNPVDLDSSYRTAHLLLRGPAQLALTITSPGFSSTSRATTQGEPVTVLPVKMPARDATGAACMRNEGSQRL